MTKNKSLIKNVLLHLPNSITFYLKQRESPFQFEIYQKTIYMFMDDCSRQSQLEIAYILRSLSICRKGITSGANLKD